MSHIYQPSESSFFVGIDKFSRLCKKISMSINNEIKKLLIDPAIWRFVGFVSSAVGLLCFALSLSFQRLFGEWNIWKIFLYGALSFIITGFMLFPKKLQLDKSMWLKVHIVFLVFVLTSLGSFFYEKKASGKPDRLGLSSISLFALSSFSLSRQIDIGFEVGFTNFFLATFTVQIMQLNPYLVCVPAAIYYAIVAVRSYLESRVEETVALITEYVAIDIDRLRYNLGYFYWGDDCVLPSPPPTYLHQDHYPFLSFLTIRVSFRTIRVSFLTIRPETLVELHIHMPDSHITKLWGRLQDFINLKILKVTGCLQLMGFPNLLEASKFEEADLNECANLCHIPSSLLLVDTHAELNVNSCKKLGSLQNESHSKSPKRLSFQDCSSLKKLSKVKTE